MTEADLIAIGQIVGAHGLDGEVRVYPLTDFPERFSTTQWAYLGSERVKVDFEWAKEHKNVIILKLRTVRDRVSAEKLRGTYLYVKPEDTVELPDDTFYTWKLKGCLVQDEDGNTIGTVKEVLTGTGNDLLVVDTGNQKPSYLPFVREFVKNIDLSAKAITVKPIPGLLDP